MTKWTALQVEKTVEALETDSRRGLSTAQAAARREKYGLNELEEKAGTTLWAMFLSQFKEFLVLLLIAAAAISLFLGEIKDASVIIFVVLVNAILGVIQEYKAEKSLEALKTLSASSAKVVREGIVKELPAKELVPGDVILLEAGDYVPADCRLVESADLRVNESALTGESIPVEKMASFVSEEPLPLADQQNMAFKGTVVTGGRGKALVVAIGMNTEIGRIAGMIRSVEQERTPLQKTLARLGRQLAFLAIFLCALVFLLGILRDNPVIEMFFVAVSLAVAAIPEGMPAIVTIVLALGVQRMAARKAIIRRLPAVETLGAATVICSDKTGTLTQNAMTVRRLYCASGLYQLSGEGYEVRGEFSRSGAGINPAGVPELSLLLAIGVLANDALLAEEEEGIRVIGDPTEGALITAAAKGDLHRGNLEINFPRIKEYPFESERKRMSTVHRGSLPFAPSTAPTSEYWLLTKGAPDLVIERCRYILYSQGIRELDEAARKEIQEVNRQMSEEALRVLALAFRPLEENLNLLVEEAETGLIFVGFMGMLDPPRVEAADAIEVCRQANIKVKMITGDHKDTALAIAQELKLAVAEGAVLSGSDLDGLSQEQLEKRAPGTAVFARVSPEHKLRIVSALQANGEIVAMTGDGVNDAPALKKANIGISMGITGTAVAREASDIILADDNFATIVRAVQEGRVIFENIKKAVYNLFSCNLGEILVILVAIILGWPLPLLPIHILWINLVTDSMPSLALGVDPPEKGMMKRLPRLPGEGIFNRKFLPTLMAYGILIGLITLIAFYLGNTESLEIGRTMAFATLALSQLVHAFNFRSLHGSVFKAGLLKNRPLIWAILASLFLQCIVLFIPFMQDIFRVVSLSPANWYPVIALALSPLLFGEVWKSLHGWNKEA